MKQFLKACQALLQVSQVGQAQKKRDLKIEQMEHDIQEINMRNFNGQISNKRKMNVCQVWYFEPDSQKDKDFLQEYNKLQKDTKGMVVTQQMNCQTNRKHCNDKLLNLKKGEINVVIYPPMPQQHFNYQGKFEQDAVKKMMFRFIPDYKVTVLNRKEELQAFNKKQQTKPKVILYSEKKKIPQIFKQLSTETVFERTVLFGFVSKETQQDVVAQQRVSKFPHITLQNKGKKQVFKDKEGVSFKQLHHWINLHSESGMGDTLKHAQGQNNNEEPEEQEVERLRELHGKSQSSLCFGQKSVCQVYLSQGPISEGQVDMMLEQESKFESKNERDIKFNWMWMDVSVEKEYQQTLQSMEKRLQEKEDRDEENPLSYPSMMFVKPPKKKREQKLLSYVKMQSGQAQPTPTHIQQFVEKIQGGQSYARQDLPKFVTRVKKPKTQAKQEL